MAHVLSALNMMQLLGARAKSDSETAQPLLQSSGNNITSMLLFKQRREREEQARQLEIVGLIKGLKEKLKELFNRSGLSGGEWTLLAEDAAGLSLKPGSAITLPEQAPATWETRNRTTEKDPVAFLRRHWGVYMDAGVLYQDDIARLGDPKLVQTIRSWCQGQAKKFPARANEFIAHNFLPPPGSDRALKIAAGLPVEVREAAYLLVHRERSAQARSRKQNALI